MKKIRLINKLMFILVLILPKILFAGTDTTAPVVTITSPSNGQTVNSLAPINIAANIDDISTVASNIQEAYYTIDGDTSLSWNRYMSSQDGNFNAPIENVIGTFGNINTLSNGSHTITVFGWDSAGNVGNASVNIIKTGPTVMITNPADGSTVSGIINIEAVITDTTAGFFSINASYSIDGQSFTAMHPMDSTFDSTTEDVIGVFDTRTTSNGSHQITVTGGVFVNPGSSTIDIYIDNNYTPPSSNDTTAPVITITSPSDGELVWGIIDIDTIINDSTRGGSNIHGAVYSVDGGSQAHMNPLDGVFNSPVENARGTLDTKTLANGTHTLAVYGWDSLTNMANMSITINVNNVQPSTLAGNIDIISFGSINRVDGHDLYLFSLTFGANPQDPNWYQIADFNRDGIIDGNDLVILAANFGQKN